MSHHFKFYVFLSLTLPKFWNRYIFQKFTMEFFLNVFIESGEFSDKKYLSFNGLEPPTSCVRDQDASKRETLTPIHASVIYKIPWIRWNHWI